MKIMEDINVKGNNDKWDKIARRVNAGLLAGLAGILGFGLGVISMPRLTQPERPLNRTYVMVSSGEYIVSEFSDRYQASKLEGIPVSHVRDMVDNGKDGKLDFPTDEEHSQIYAEIYKNISQK